MSAHCMPQISWGYEPCLPVWQDPVNHWYLLEQRYEENFYSVFQSAD